MGNQIALNLKKDLGISKTEIRISRKVPRFQDRDPSISKKDSRISSKRSASQDRFPDFKQGIRDLKKDSWISSKRSASQERFPDFKQEIRVSRKIPGFQAKEIRVSLERFPDFKKEIRISRKIPRFQERDPHLKKDSPITRKRSGSQEIFADFKKQEIRDLKKKIPGFQAKKSASSKKDSRISSSSRIKTLHHPGKLIEIKRLGAIAQGLFRIRSEIRR